MVTERSDFLQEKCPSFYLFLHLTFFPIFHSKVSLRIKSSIDKGRYKVIVHYYQPSYGRYFGRIIVQSGRSTALSLQFKFCPNVGGCRALARDKITGFSRSLYVYDDVDMTISIPAPNELWIVSSLHMVLLTVIR